MQRRIHARPLRLVRTLLAAALAAILATTGAMVASADTSDGPAEHGTYAFPGNDGRHHTVDFDAHSFTVDGERLNIWSGEFHYWRLPSPDHWRDLLQKMKSAGFNAVSLYFFWGLHQDERGGEFDFSGIKDIDRLLTMAEEEGLYVIARPGPYVNAEISMGGLPAYLTNEAAPLRSSESDKVLADNLAWLDAINAIIAKHQVTDGGGSVLMYQVENELISESAARMTYLQDLTQAVKDDGITVPMFHNDYGMGGRFADTEKTGLDFYAYDNYPLGFNCGAKRGRIGESEASYRRISSDSPQFITEAQGGAFTPWGASFTPEACYEFTDPAFTRQWGVRNIGNGVTAYNYYMVFGGTNWGWTGSPSSGFTSYDYGAAINEDRTLTEKFSVQKEIGYYQKAVPDLTSMVPRGSVTPDVESGSAVKAYQRVATDEDAAGATEGGKTQFLGFRLGDSNDTTTTNFTFPLILGDQGSGEQADTTTDDRNEAIAYAGTWDSKEDGAAYEQTVTASTEPGARVSYTFTGTSIQVVTPTGTDHGVARVFVDGEEHGTYTSHVDTEQNKPAQQVSYEVAGMTPGEHTIEIEVTGEPVEGGTGAVVAIDAFIVPDTSTTQWNDSHENIAYTGSWEHATGKAWTSGDIDGDETFSSTAGDSYEFSFTGAGFELIGPFSQNHGSADVYVDGAKVGQTNEEVTGGALPQQVLFGKRDLTYGTHTVKVVVTGDAFPGSSGAFHSLDAVRTYESADDGNPIPEGAIGWERVPQKEGTSLTLHGRDALMVTANTLIGGHELYYTTSQLFGAALDRRGGTLQYAIGHTGDSGETVLHYDTQPAVTAPNGVEVTWDADTGELRLNYEHGSPVNITVDDGESPLTLRVMDRDHAQTVWFVEGKAPKSSTAAKATASDLNSTVVVEGAYVPRTVTFEGSTADLTGSMAEAGTLRIDVPDGTETVSWNGAAVSVKNGVGLFDAPGPEAVETPVLQWVAQSDDSEADPDYDDSAWTVADDTEGSTSQQGPGENQGVVLDSNHYEFYEGAVWYRANYIASDDGGTIRLKGNGGSGQPGHGKAPAFMQVWVNGQYAGSPSAHGDWEDVAIPEGAAAAGEDVVVSVLVHNLGQNLDWSDNGLSKQNRGLFDAQLTNDGDVTWMINGATAADASVERTIYNSGGLSGELSGWHLPAYDDSSWDTAESLVAEEPGVRWYRSTVDLDVPEGQDTAFHLTVHSSKFDDGRSDGSQAVLYVNGWNTGVYIGDIGPQSEFTVPSGFLNMRGENEIAVVVSAKAAGMGPESITLDAVHSTTGAVSSTADDDSGGGSGENPGDGEDGGSNAGGEGNGNSDETSGSSDATPGDGSTEANAPGAGTLPVTGFIAGGLIIAAVVACASGVVMTFIERLRRSRAQR